MDYKTGCFRIDKGSKCGIRFKDREYDGVSAVSLEQGRQTLTPHPELITSF